MPCSFFWRAKKKFVHILSCQSVTLTPFINFVLHTLLNSSTFLESQFSMHHLSVCPFMCILSTRMDSSAAGVRYFPIRDPPDNSPNRVYPGTVLGIPSGILRTTWDYPVDPIRDPPDNSPKRVCPGTVLGIPSGILRTTAPTVSILGLPWGSHASGILVHMLLMS